LNPQPITFDRKHLPSHQSSTSCIRSKIEIPQAKHNRNQKMKQQKSSSIQCYISAFFS